MNRKSPCSSLVRNTRTYAITLFAALFFVACFGTTASAQNFLQSKLTTGPNPSVIKTADVNKDGHLDLIMISAPMNSTSSDLVVHLGHGDGTFAAGVAFHSGITWPGQKSVMEFEVLDVNGDGNVDLVYAGGDKLGIMLGNGDGTFQQPRLFQASVQAPDSGDALNSLGVGDFNKDGHKDFVVSSQLNIEIFYGNGDGTVQPVQVMTVGRPAGDPNGQAFAANAEAGDFDADGNDDIVFSIDNNDEDGGNISAWFGNGAGAFPDQRMLDTATPLFRGLKVRDLNKDGRDDISAIFPSCNFAPCAGAVTYVSNGDRTFTRHVMNADGVSGGPSFAAFDTEGLTDLVTTGCRFIEFDSSCAEDVVQVFPLASDGSFFAGVEQIDLAPSRDKSQVTPDNVDVIAGDFNGDGRSDVAVALHNSSAIAIFMNGGGIVDSADCANTTSGTEHICEPQSGATVASPVRINAHGLAISGHTIQTSGVYVDGVRVHTSGGGIVTTAFPMSNGSHKVTVKGWDETGSVAASTSETISVGSSTAPPPPPTGTCTAPNSAPNNSVTICTPTNGATTSSPVHITAAAKSSSKVTATKIYVDGTSKFSGTSASIDTSLAMSAGSHRITVKAWIGSTPFSSTINITVK